MNTIPLMPTPSEDQESLAELSRLINIVTVFAHTELAKKSAHIYSHILKQFAPAAVAALLLVPSSAVAGPDKNADCRSCHSDIFRNGMSLMNFQATTNLLKIFTVIRGQALPIGIQVTNGYSGNYGLSLLNLRVAGNANPTNRLSYTGDPAWANRLKASVNWFTIGPISTVPRLWTNNITILSNTPPDLYLVQVQMAGTGFDSFQWSQLEDFYIRVLTPVPPTPLITSPTRSGTQFSVQVTTASGFTYYLEYKTSLTNLIWNVAASVPGNGAVQTLTDTTATDPQRVYRVMVQ